MSCDKQSDGLLSEPNLSGNFNHFLHKSFNILNPRKEFINNWHLDVICHYLSEVSKGNVHRLIINMPPRALKSFTVNVSWPAWLLGNDPSLRIISASYALFLSIKHSMDTRNIINSDLFRNTFVDFTLNEKDNRKEKFVTTQHGFRFATSTGGSITGEGGDILILDDPHNALHVSSRNRRQLAIDWFRQSFVSRLDDKKNGKIIVVMQRLHHDDLTGFLLREQPDLWKHVEIPTIAPKNITYHHANGKYVFKRGKYLHPEREGKREIDRVRKELGDAAFSAQYLQKPLVNESGAIKKSWFQYYKKVDHTNFRCITVSWDTAIKVHDDSSYSVATVWGDNYNDEFYLLDLLRGKWEYPDLRKKFEEFNRKWNPNYILVEDKASGQALVQDFRYQYEMNIVPIRPYNNKILRLSRASVFFEKKTVYFPLDAIWRADYEQELLLFPSAKNDDQVDSTSQYFNYILTNNSCGKPQISIL